MKNFQIKIEQEITDFASKHPNEYKTIIDKITSYNRSDYTDDFYSFQVFKNQIKEIYLNQALEDYHISKNENLRNEIIAIADYMIDRRYDVMIALDDEEAFNKVLGYATDCLKGEDFLYFQQLYVNEQSLFALAKAYYNPKFKQAVILFFETSFDYVKNYAKENDNHYNSSSADPDGSTLLELAQAISSLKEEDREQFSNLVFEIYAFSSNEKRSYGMNQASGFIALLLTLYSATIDKITFLNDTIAKKLKHYKENIYVHQILYAKWYLEKNHTEALAYLQNDENAGWPTFAILALADLGWQEALPFLIEKQKGEKNPVVWEVYQEAIHRLSTKYQIANNEDRMIWLNGNLTPTQRALGAESDNVFVKRAQQKLAIDATVYETDEE
ncbi:hypothetical protein CLU83_1919 [Flavobacterium sp. 1]|uniref:hypothetical protein n=1 Tax=Flavobacterium sp. 1 TaxID=2035200 RepID=UPI000C244523|nr:hypothetical protein [Flavobacterium sp. 1]PJJ08633.1 hypothetical protein CLU83_1919 [Flavobacterium sp. 1]